MISWAKLALGQTQELAPPQEQMEETLEAPPEPVTVFAPLPPSPPPISRPSLVLPWVLCALMMVVMGVLVGGQLRRAQRLEQQLLKTQQQMTQLQSQKRELMQQLTDFQAERNALDERVFSLNVQLSSAAAQLERANARLAQAEELSKQLSETQAQLQGQIASAREEREAAAREAERFEQEKTELRRSVNRLRQQLALVERDYRDLSVRLASLQSAPNPGVSIVSSTGPLVGSAPSLDRAENAREAGIDRTVTATSLSPNAVELAPVVIRKDQSSMAGLLQGHLVDVNDQHQFVIIDKGLRDGVQEGMVFDIRHGGTFVGQATVVRVRPQLAACNLRRTVSAQPVRIGDLVVARSR